jgi:putative aldouronate transport system substrate-binding protein
MSKRNLLLTLICIVLSFSFLSACGGGGSSSKTTEPPKDTKEAEAKPAEKTDEKPVELIWYMIGTPQKDTDKVFEELSKYTKEKINATVKMKLLDWGEYDQKMPVIAASGEPFDIAFTCSWAFNYVTNARKGAFLEIGKLLDEKGAGIKEVLHPAFLEGAKVDGKLYAIPTNKELPAQDVWRFNQKFVEKYNFDISSVKSLESLEPMLKTIKEKEKGIVPLGGDKNFKPLLPFDYVDESIPIALYADGRDTKLMNILETPETMQALETMHKYYKAGYVSKDLSTINSNDYSKTGKWFTDRANTAPLADNQWSASYGYKIVSTPANEPLVYNWSVTGSMNAISATSQNPEKAMEFLNLLNTDPYVRNMVGYGIENVHYKKIGDNRIELLPALTEGYTVPGFALGNVMITYLQKDDPENKWDEYKKFNESAKNAPLLGFNFNPTPVMNEMAALKNVKEEFYPPLMTGTVDPVVNLPKAIKKFKDAGIDKVRDEMQRQFDEWRAKQ